jgi:hypothetical protein
MQAGVRDFWPLQIGSPPPRRELSDAPGNQTGQVHVDTREAPLAVEAGKGRPIRVKAPANFGMRSEPGLFRLRKVHDRVRSPLLGERGLPGQGSEDYSKDCDPAPCARSRKPDGLPVSRVCANEMRACWDHPGTITAGPVAFRSDVRWVAAFPVQI